MTGPFVFRRLFPAVLAAVLILAAASVGQAEMRLQPSILVSEEYNDNIYLTPEAIVYDSAQKKWVEQENFAAYITRIKPSVLFSYSSSLWDWNIAGTYDYRYYSHLDYADDTAYTFHASQQTRVITNFFNIDLKDDRERVSTNPARDYYTQQSDFVHQTDRNVLTAHPYFMFRLAPSTMLNLGYAYIDTRYRQTGNVDTRENVGSAELAHELSSRTTLSIAVSRTKNDNDLNYFVKNEALAGFNHSYADSSQLSAMIGYDVITPEKGEMVRQPVWELRGLHKFPTVSASLEMGFRFIPDPQNVIRREDRYLASLNKTTERTSLTISGGMREYRLVQGGYLETTNYNLGASFSHNVFEKTRISYSLYINRIVENTSNSPYTTVYLTDVRFEQTFFENAVWALEYRYGDSYSPDIFTNNYKNNRITLEISKRF